MSSGKSVLLDPQPSLLTLRRRNCRLCSNDSSVLCRSVTPRGRACEPCGLSLRSPTCCRTGVRCLRGLPVLVHEVSRRVWGLRPRRTVQELALSLPSMLPSAHFYRVGVRVVCFRGSMATPPILYLRFAGSLAVAAQDSRPSGSLLLSCKALSSSTSCRFSPAHKHPYNTQNPTSTSAIACFRQSPTPPEYNLPRKVTKSRKHWLRYTRNPPDFSRCRFHHRCPRDFS